MCPSLFVYFKNNDWTDCRRSNLAIGTRRDLSGNMTPAKKKKHSSYLWPCVDGGWIARAWIDGKVIKIGTFATMHEAEEARQRKIKSYSAQPR